MIGHTPTLSAALQTAATEQFDAAVLDVNLNGDLVWPVAHVIHERGIPFIFATGYSGIIDIPSAVKDALRMEKPFEADRLVQTLAAAIAGVGAR